MVYTPPFIAFLLASGITFLEILTSEYPRTFNFILTCWKLWVYALVYGIIAFIVACFADQLIETGDLTISGFGTSNPWVRALAIGLAIKAVLHIRLFSVSIQGKVSTPIGLETILLLFEPWLLKGIKLHETVQISKYFDNWLQNHPLDLDQMRSRVAKNLQMLESEEKKALVRDINDSEIVTCERDLMYLYIKLFGKNLFEQIFK